MQSELDGKSDGAEKIFAYLERHGITREEAVTPRERREDVGGDTQKLVLAFFPTEDGADEAAKALKKPPRTGCTGNARRAGNAGDERNARRNDRRASHQRRDDDRSTDARPNSPNPDPRNPADPWNRRHRRDRRPLDHDPQRPEITNKS